jgi:hypothetical protein
VAREVEQRAVFIGAGGDDIDITAEDPSDVGDRLALAEADFGLAQVDGVAAQLLHGDIEADAGAQGGLFEDQGERFPYQRIMAAPSLQAEGGLEMVSPLGAEVGDGEHVAAAQGKPPKALAV